MADKKDRELSDKDLKKASGGKGGADSARVAGPSKNPAGTARDGGSSAGHLGGRGDDVRPDKKKK